MTTVNYVSNQMIDGPSELVHSQNMYIKQISRLLFVISTSEPVKDTIHRQSNSNLFISHPVKAFLVFHHSTELKPHGINPYLASQKKPQSEKKSVSIFLDIHLFIFLLSSD